jgi:hypothetical protein
VIGSVAVVEMKPVYPPVKVARLVWPRSAEHPVASLAWQVELALAWQVELVDQEHAEQ